MERRKAIKNIGLSAGAMMASPSIMSLLQSCQPSAERWIPTFYTEEEGIFIRNLIRIFLPANGELPGAIELGIHVFIDKYQKEVLPVNEKGPHRKSLKIAMDDLLKESNRQDISSASDSDYEQLLKKHLSGSYDQQQAMVDEIDDHLDANNDESTGLPENLRIFMFLNDLRCLSIWAYQNNENVGENIMAYKPVPGEQKGCVGLDEATAGMAWSLS